MITQHGLMYAAGLNTSRRALYFLATPPALFDPFVDQVDTAELRDGAVVIVDSRFGRDLASAHPMDAALRRILDEHLALRVDLPGQPFLVAVFLIRRLFRGGFTDGRLPSLLIEAVKYNVLSLDDRSFERANPDIAGRQQLIRGNTELLYSAMRE